MQKLLLAVDRLSTWLGKTFAWAIILLTGAISFEVFSRYVLGKPHAWMFDVQIMLYGVLFMMAGAYTLSKNGHVRGDVLYGFFRPRTQATLDLILYILFFLPGVFAMTWAGWTYFQESLAIREQTIICIREGQWPSREQDVEEVDVEKLKAMVHADDQRELAAPPAEKGSPL
jgi:TRAP-type mannitol/chloroaromatic compound transport system permease small subunit